MVLLLILISIVILKRNKKTITSASKIIFLIYSLIALIAFFISFGLLIQVSRADKSGLPGPFILFYYLVPGFNGLRALGRYSVFVILSISVFIAYATAIWQKKIKDVFLKIILSFIIIVFFTLEMSFVPLAVYYPLKTNLKKNELFEWMASQPENKIFLEMPLGVDQLTFMNHDLYYTFDSRNHFRKIVNGYSGYQPPGYLHLMENLLSFDPDEDLPLIKKFQANYIIFHFDRYLNAQKNKAMLLKKISKSSQLEYVKNFGENYVYQIIYD